MTTPMDMLKLRCDAVDFDTMTPPEFGAFVNALSQDEFLALVTMFDKYRADAPAGELIDGLDPIYGLPGCWAQTPEAAASAKAAREIEEHVLRLLDELKVDAALQPDPRWLATGRTYIELGFMAVQRSIFKPGRVDLGGSPETESGWLLERADSSAASPLYYYPAAHGSQWIEDSEKALRFSRAADARLLAMALGVKVRVAEHMWD